MLTATPNHERTCVPAADVARTCILKAWGYLVRRGKNHILSDWAVGQGYGKNARGQPIFFADRVPEIVRALDWPGIVSTARSILDRKERLTWLLEDHAHLPDATVAELSGYSVQGVKAARKAVLSRDGRAWRTVVHPDDLEPVY